MGYTFGNGEEQESTFRAGLSREERRGCKRSLSGEAEMRLGAAPSIGGH